ncbi:hypothetical protein F4775DRAFT_577257 [Biscogniauxia sp. FL1348]|nr:hypothetical protein F4775DRAFT_577257 [Biscogniauxia sp. FL1348]
MATVTIEPAPLSSHLSEHINGGGGGTDADTGKRRERHDVSTFINYYKDPGDGSPPMPIRISEKTVKNERPTVAYPTIVRDITGEEHRYTLDAHGFQLCRRESGLSGEEDFRDDAKVRDAYYPECEALLRDVTGAARVLIFDHKTRSGPSHWHRLGENNRAARGPLLRAHVDQSYDGAEIVLRRHFPREGEAEELMTRRWMIVNIWRPIKTVFKDPLAAADATSIPDADLVAAQILYRDGSRDETWTILPPSSSSSSASPSSKTTTTAAEEDEASAGERNGKMREERGHRWYFKYAQTPAEVLLIKCFDSGAPPRGVVVPAARRAPHSAFVDPAHEDGEARASVEARGLVLF